MKPDTRRRLLLCAAVILLAGTTVAQDEPSTEQLKKRLEKQAQIERLVMVPMRDGVRLATDVYRPVEAEGRLPTIFWRTPYNYSDLDSRRLKFVVDALDHGYVFVIQNERGRYYSEGEWTILGHPRTDGYDALNWIAEQPWSNGRVGTIGCSSSAEWQLALAAMDHPAHAAMVPMASGAGIGRVGSFHEQGNWYRGGVFQMLFATWLYSVQNTQRPTLPEGTSREDMLRLSKYYDLAPEMPEVDWAKAIRHLPLTEILEEVEGPKGMYADFIRRHPGDPAWYEGGLYHDDEPFEVPSLWLNSWYDVSIGPNLALFNHVSDNAKDPEVARNQFTVIAPTPHCGFYSATEETIVGERNMGDAQLDYDALIYGLFDRWVKGEKNRFEKNTPRVQYYLMGQNEWRTSSTWPPEDTETMTFFLDSAGRANSLFGDGRLTLEIPDGDDAPDTFPYDPTVPVPSLGGGVCCTGGAVTPGSFDQRALEARHDVLVYTSEPLEKGLEVSGSIEVTLYVSSDARDTDFTVKLIDVDPEGVAYNVDDTIQRARYREGYDKQVFMEPGNIYELEVSSMTTSNYFKKGHRIRVEISSSNFPRYARNLNTGGNNYDEVEGVVAHNSVHHSRQFPSNIRLPVAPSR